MSSKIAVQRDYSQTPNQIKKYRMRAGLSQQELAERVGMSRTGIAQLERRGNWPRDVKQTKDIAAVLKVSVEKILGNEDDNAWVNAGFYLPGKSDVYLTAFRLKYSTDYRFSTLYFDADTKGWRYLDGAGRFTNDRFND